MIGRGALFLGVLLLACAALPAQGLHGAVRASAVIDVTLRCTTPLSGGIREIGARANTGSRLRDSWVRLPFGAASAGNVTYGLGDSLGWISAGKPSPTTKLDLGFRATSALEWGTVGVSRAACRSTSAKVALTRAGLAGGKTPALGERFECPAPRSVLLRVRAVSTARTALRAKGDFLVTNVPLKSARLTVRTTKGKALMYADVVETGRARLFAAKGCVSD